MKDRKEFKLMDGDYRPAEARNLLFGLLDGKMGFHNLEIMKSLENTDGNLRRPKNDLNDLNSAKEEICAMLKDAGINGKRVQLRGNFEILVEG